MRKLHALVLGGIVAGAAAAVAIAAPGGSSGPSSSQPPYIVRSQPGVVLKSILTVGDAAPNGYRMVGIPDGLGSFDNGDGTFTVLMNHELSTGQGIARAHHQPTADAAAKGSFVSRWVVRNDTLEVVAGDDLIEDLYTYSGGAYAPVTGAAANINRLCSADLPPASAFYAPSGNGYDGRIFLNGEESGSEGRAFAHFVGGAIDGSSYELPHLGKFSWENAVAHPNSGESTIVVGLDDSGGGQVYVYKGAKSATGSAVAKAGLSGGTLYGIKVNGFTDESPATGIPSGTAFTGYALGDVSAKTGVQLEAASDAGSVTQFFRPEDGAWDTQDPSVFYFVTTADINAKSRLWKLDFVDPTNPAAGGTISMVLDGSEGPKMMDNLTVNDRGQVLIQEDPGGNAPTGQSNYLAKLWLYSPATGTVTEIAQHDPALFTPGLTGFLTTDEESSGIVPAPFLGESWYLLDVQAHYTIAGELAQGGQLLALHVPPGKFKE